MAGPRTRRSPRNNPPLTGEDELAGDAPEAPTKGSSTPTSAPAQVPTSVPGPTGMYTDVDLQRATRLALESFVKGQEHG